MSAPPSPASEPSDAATLDPAPTDPPPAAGGQLWSIDAGGLCPELLAGEDAVRALGALFDDLVEALGLHPVMEPRWHVFPGPHAGVTGFVALSESHLACHSFPEHGGLTLDLYTCRPRRAPDWRALVERRLGGAGPVELRGRTLHRALPAASDR